MVTATSFGEITESLAEPSIRRILDEHFDAGYQKGEKFNWWKEVGMLEVDAWGEARNSVKAVYLVEIKSQFKPKHIQQMLRQVERFRYYVWKYRQLAVFPVVAAVQISDEDRRQVWKAGMCLIDIADGVFELAEPPFRFIPNGNYGTEVVRRDVPPLHLVRND